MYDDGFFDDGMVLVFFVVIVVIIAAVSFVAFLPASQPNIVYKCGSGCMVSSANETPFDPTGCIGKKTATIFVMNEFMTNYIVDSDGCYFDWTGGGTNRFDVYNGHNVTFIYDQCDPVRGRARIMKVVKDNSACCNTVSCGCGR